MEAKRIYMAAALAASLVLTGCPFDNQEEVGENVADAAVGEGGEGEGEGEGEGGDGEGEGGEGEGEGEGGEGEGEGEGGEGEGEGEAECRGDQARECQTDCFRGEQRCVEGQWSDCSRDAARCDVEACQRELPDRCGEPVQCEAGDTRECEQGCFIGTQTCREGRWSDCSRDRPRCGNEDCARELPDRCGEPAECDGGVRECDHPCFFGEQRCVEGRWSECSRDRARCDIAECARELPDACGEPAQCDGGARECETDCFVGVSECVEGRWGECTPRRVRCDVEACAREFADECGEAPACEAGAQRECDHPCFFGTQTCREGQWSECSRDRARCDIAECARELPDRCGEPAQCDAGAERECEAGCFIGAQVCREGRWSDCSQDRVRCGVAECAREFPDACGGERECEAGAARECDWPCFFGEQRCVEGRWSECSREVPRCDVEGCARELPDLCREEPPACEAGATRECEAECFVGVSTCREGAWSACTPREARCDREVCAREFPDLCAEPPACEAGAVERCETDCFVGTTTCREGQWTACAPREVRCDRAVCAREFADFCAEAPVCEAGAQRECEQGCFIGTTTCREGQWSECSQDRVRCGIAECAREFPDACAR